MEPMETEPNRRVPRGLSVGRVVNLLMGFLFLLIMVTALVVVGVLGGLNLSLSRFPDAFKNTSACPLFMYLDCVAGDTGCNVVYGPVSVCYFVESAFGAIGFASLAYFVVQVFRVVFKFNLWFTTILDMILVGITGLACFATAITISVGLAVTCEKVDQKLHSGCNVLIPYNNRETGSEFYTLMNAVQGAAWMCMLFIFVMFVVTILRLVIFIKRRRAGTPIDMDGTLLSDDFDDKPSRAV